MLLPACSSSFRWVGAALCVKRGPSRSAANQLPVLKKYQFSKKRLNSTHVKLLTSQFSSDCFSDQVGVFGGGG